MMSTSATGRRLKDGEVALRQYQLMVAPGGLLLRSSLTVTCEVEWEGPEPRTGEIFHVLSFE